MGRPNVAAVLPSDLPAPTPPSRDSSALEGSFPASQLSALSELLSRDDGWLRVVPEDHGRTVWYKWKFSRGPWAGYYVMWRGDVHTKDACFTGLLTRIMQVYRGVKQPTKDTAYNAD